MAQEANRRAIQVIAAPAKALVAFARNRAFCAFSRLARRRRRLRGVVTITPAPRLTRWDVVALRALGFMPGMRGAEGEGGGAPAGGAPGGEGGEGGGAPAGGEPGARGSDGGGKTFSREYVEELRREAAGYRTKLKEHEDRDKTELERANSERDELKAKLTPVEQENMRLRVGLEKGLPAKLVDRLRGSTKEELERDADELLADFGGDSGGSKPRIPRGPSGDKNASAGSFEAAIRRAAGRG